MWIWNADKTGLVNTNLCSVIDMTYTHGAGGEKITVRAADATERHDIFIGTEAECIDYLGKLNADLVQDANRVAAAIDSVYYFLSNYVK